MSVQSYNKNVAFSEPIFFNKSVAISDPNIYKSSIAVSEQNIYKTSIPVSGLAVTSSIGIILLMPVIVVSGLGIALYYIIKK